MRLRNRLETHCVSVTFVFVCFLIKCVLFTFIIDDSCRVLSVGGCCRLKEYENRNERIGSRFNRKTTQTR